MGHLTKQWGIQDLKAVLRVEKYRLSKKHIFYSWAWLAWEMFIVYDAKFVKWKNIKKGYAL